jgi:hypothetical protein
MTIGWQSGRPPHFADHPRGEYRVDRSAAEEQRRSLRKLGVIQFGQDRKSLYSSDWRVEVADKLAAADPQENAILY